MAELLKIDDVVLKMVIFIHSFIITPKAANNKYRTYRKTKNIHNTKIQLCGHSVSKI